MTRYNSLILALLVMALTGYLAAVDRRAIVVNDAKRI